MMDIETSFKSLEFEWVTIQSKITQYERILRELRITSLVLALVLSWVTFIVNIKIPLVSGIFLAFAILWWTIIYVWTLIPLANIGHSYSPEIEARHPPGRGPEEQADLVEFARRYLRISRRRLSTTVLLFSAGMLLTMMGFVASVFMNSMM